MKKRLFYLDVLRSIAIVLVVLTHCASTVQSVFAGAQYDSYEYQFCNVFDIITRIGVPLFVMISGRLMLDRELDEKKTRKRARSFLLLFFFWSFVYSIILVEIKCMNGYSMVGLIVNTILDTSKGYYHFWYLFMIAGLYLGLPFLHALNNGLTAKQKKEYVVLGIVVCIIIPTITQNAFATEYFGIIKNINIGIWGLYPLYFLLGYWLRNKRIENKTVCSVAICIMLGTAVFLTNYLSKRFNEDYTLFRENYSPFIFSAAVLAYVLANSCFEENEAFDGGAFAAAVSFISQNSFGIYLSHVLFIELLRPYIIPKYCEISLFAFFIFVFAVSSVITCLLHKTKYTRLLVS